MGNFSGEDPKTQGVLRLSKERGRVWKQDWIERVLAEGWILFGEAQQT